MAIAPVTDALQTRSLRPSPVPPQGAPLTFAEYITAERVSEVNHHFYYGRLIEVAGASYEHNIICANLIVALGLALEDTDCRTLGSDQKIYVSESVGYYPDVVVTCGDALITMQEALQNPVLIAEILSPSTAAYDRGEKFRQYRTVESLRHVLFIEQDSPVVEHYFRGDDSVWKVGSTGIGLNQTLEITIADKAITLPLSKIYRNIGFPVPATNGETAEE